MKATAVLVVLLTAAGCESRTERPATQPVQASAERPAARPADPPKILTRLSPERIATDLKAAGFTVRPSPQLDYFTFGSDRDKIEVEVVKAGPAVASVRVTINPKSIPSDDAAAAAGKVIVSAVDDSATVAAGQWIDAAKAGSRPHSENWGGVYATAMPADPFIVLVIRATR